MTLRITSEYKNAGIPSTAWNTHHFKKLLFDVSMLENPICEVFWWAALKLPHRGVEEYYRLLIMILFYKEELFSAQRLVRTPPVKVSCGMRISAVNSWPGSSSCPPMMCFCKNIIISISLPRNIHSWNVTVTWAFLGALWMATHHLIQEFASLQQATLIKEAVPVKSPIASSRRFGTPEIMEK